jgi:hypothetical protein
MNDSSGVDWVVVANPILTASAIMKNANAAPSVSMI